MSRTTLQSLDDVTRYASCALAHAEAIDAAHPDDSLTAFHAALFALVVVGEALNRVPRETRGLAPNIPWTGIVAMRNLIVHAYWQIDLPVTLSVIRRDVPPLLREVADLRRYLATEEV